MREVSRGLDLRAAPDVAVASSGSEPAERRVRRPGHAMRRADLFLQPGLAHFERAESNAALAPSLQPLDKVVPGTGPGTA